MAWDSSTGIPDLKGKVAIVTGGNTGIGKECVHQLVIHNAAKAYIATRNESRAKTAIDDLSKEFPEVDVKSKVVFLKLDLSGVCERVFE